MGASPLDVTAHNIIKNRKSWVNSIFKKWVFMSLMSISDFVTGWGYEEINEIWGSDYNMCNC